MAHTNKIDVEIIGKLDNTFRRIGQYEALMVENAIRKVMNIEKREVKLDSDPVSLCTKRPIDFCAGCPHRGTYVGMEMGLNAHGLKKEQAFITGDIGCTILGSCPPYSILWTELAMGASIPLAQGVAHSNIPAPVFATIGDSTFFHAGMPGLVNMLQHNVNMTLVILDNGWTGMAGMQINPGTEQQYQMHDWKQLDIVEVVKGMGVENLWVVDAYDVPAVAKATEEALNIVGPKVIISRRECATQAGRHRGKYNDVSVAADKCIGCKKCIVKSGCAALLYDAEAKKVSIDAKLCNGCAVCTNVCPVKAIDVKKLGGDK